MSYSASLIMGNKAWRGLFSGSSFDILFKSFLLHLIRPPYCKVLLPKGSIKMLWPFILLFKRKKMCKEANNMQSLLGIILSRVLKGIPYIFNPDRAGLFDRIFLRSGSHWNISPHTSYFKSTNLILSNINTTLHNFICWLYISLYADVFSFNKEMSKNPQKQWK